MQINVLSPLERRQLVVLCQRLQVLQYHRLDLFVLAQLLQAELAEAVGCGPDLQLFCVGNDDGDQEALEGVAVDKCLGDPFGAGVDRFDLNERSGLVVGLIKRLRVPHLFRSNVLALGELEDVLDAVDDLDGTVGKNTPDVASVD